MCFRLLNSTQKMKKSKNYFKRKKPIFQLVYEMMKLWSMICNFHGYMWRWPTTVRAKTKTARQKQIPTAKPKPFCFCCEVFGFALRYCFFFLPWGFWFCRDSCGPPYLSWIYGLRKQFKHIFLFPVYMRGEGRRGKEDRLLSRICSLSSAPSFIVFSFNLLLYQTRMENTPKKRLLRRVAVCTRTFTDLHKFSCLVTSLPLGSLYSRGQYKQKLT